MRVGFITYGLASGLTGIGRYTVELMRALKRHVHDAEIIHLATQRHDRYDLAREFETHHLAGCERLPQLMTWGNLAVARATRRYGLDIIHDPNGIAPFLAQRDITRRVVTIHDAFAYVDPSTHNRLDTWRYRWMLPYAVRCADAVITVSECSRRDLVRFLGLPTERVSVIGGGVEPRFVAIEDGEARRTILAKYGIAGRYMLYVGSINARKNIARLFEAYAMVRGKFPDVTLVIGGKRQWRTAEIDATWQRLNLDDHVHFTGYVDDADLPALYSAAELFVFPSLYEGFGLPPLEAMACGTPVITSNSSSLPEVVGDAALLVEPHNTANIADAMVQLLGDVPLQAELRRRGFTQARRFTWEQAAQETKIVYQRLMTAYGGADKQLLSK